MKRTTFLVLAALLCSASLPRLARADEDAGAKAEHHHHHGDKDHHKDHKDWLKEKLGLTDEQAKKLETARKDHWDAAKPLRENLKDAMRKLKGELLIKASDDDVASALEGVKSARKALRDESEKSRASTDSILTPVQRAKMVVWRSRMMRRHRMMAMGGHGRGHWGGEHEGRGCGMKGGRHHGPRGEKGMKGADKRDDGGESSEE